MYRLHIANKNYSSWSLRPWLLLTELQIPFQESVTPFKEAGSGPTGSNYEQFSQFCPTGKVPCLHDGEKVIWDSLAICEYVAESYPTAWPEDATARAWGRSVVAEMHSGFDTLRAICGMNVGIRVTLNEVNASLQKDIDRFNAIWAEGLKRFGGPYLLGDSFTIADAFYAPVVFRVQTYGLPLVPQAERYYQTMLDNAGMKQWQHAALAETWRDYDHDREAIVVGTIDADFRAV